jgi:actin related protein 2/3 complex subunit 1A/1B
MSKVIQQKPFKQYISFHAWNADCSLVALSPNSNEVWIYKTGGKTTTQDWNKEPDYKLTEHGGFVSAIEWCHATDTIVTAGHDRNAYVWKYSEDEDAWKPTLVILRINRAATSVKWSPKGDKFAVTSGAKCIPICHFEESNDWWISKMVKKHKSTVQAVDWSPCGKYIVTGSTDFKARICSAFIEGIDEAADDAYTSHWAKQHSFGEVLAEFTSAKAWVNGVSWSPDGMNIVYTGHGATIHFAQIGGDEQTVYVKTLPLQHVQYLSNDSVLAVGFDNNPQVYVNNGSAWELLTKLDPETDDGKSGASAKKPKAFGNAFAKFQQADSKGGKFGSKAKESECKTYHKNTIYGVKMMETDAPIKKFSTSGMDGRILVWDLSGVSGLK